MTRREEDSTPTGRRSRRPWRMGERTRRRCARRGEIEAAEDVEKGLCVLFKILI
jgi:hypothetical protein